MELVFMFLGQSFAAAADLAIERNGAVQDVPYSELRRQLLEEGQQLDVDLDEWPQKKFKTRSRSFILMTL